MAVKWHDDIPEDWRGTPAARQFGLEWDTPADLRDPNYTPPPPPQQGAVGDTLDALTAGVAGIGGDVLGGIPQALGHGISSMGAPTVGGAVADFGESTSEFFDKWAQSNVAEMSDRGQEALGKKWLTGDVEAAAWSDPYAIWLQLMQTAPSAAATMGTGVVAGLKYGLKAGAAVGAGTEAGMVGGGIASDISSRIDATPDDKLTSIPGAKELLKEHTPEELRAALKLALIPKHAAGGAAWAGVTGGLGMGALLESVTKGAKTVWWKRFLKGYAIEAVQEATQEAGQASATEHALTGEWANENVAEAALAGGALGGVFGGTVNMLLDKGSVDPAVVAAGEGSNPIEPPKGVPTDVWKGLQQPEEAQNLSGGPTGPVDFDPSAQLGAFGSSGGAGPYAPTASGIPTQTATPGVPSLGYDPQQWAYTGAHGVPVSPGMVGVPAGPLDTYYGTPYAGAEGVPSGLPPGSTPAPQPPAPPPMPEGLPHRIFTPEEPAPGEESEPYIGPYVGADVPNLKPGDHYPESHEDIAAQITHMAEPTTTKDAVYISASTLAQVLNGRTLQKYLSDVFELHGDSFTTGLPEDTDTEAAGMSFYAGKSKDADFYGIPDDSGGVMVTTSLKKARKYAPGGFEGLAGRSKDNLKDPVLAASDTGMGGMGTRTVGEAPVRSTTTVPYDDDAISSALGHLQPKSALADPENSLAAQWVNNEGNVVFEQLIDDTDVMRYRAREQFKAENKGKDYTFRIIPMQDALQRRGGAISAKQLELNSVTEQMSSQYAEIERRSKFRRDRGTQAGALPPTRPKVSPPRSNKERLQRKIQQAKDKVARAEDRLVQQETLDNAPKPSKADQLRKKIESARAKATAHKQELDRRAREEELAEPKAELEAARSKRDEKEGKALRRKQEGASELGKAGRRINTLLKKGPTEENREKASTILREASEKQQRRPKAMFESLQKAMRLQGALQYALAVDVYESLQRATRVNTALEYALALSEGRTPVIAKPKSKKSLLQLPPDVSVTAEQRRELSELVTLLSFGTDGMKPIERAQVVATRIQDLSRIYNYYNNVQTYPEGTESEMSELADKLLDELGKTGNSVLKFGNVDSVRLPMEGGVESGVSVKYSERGILNDLKGEFSQELHPFDTTGFPGWHNAIIAAARRHFASAVIKAVNPRGNLNDIRKTVQRAYRALGMSHSGKKVSTQDKNALKQIESYPKDISTFIKALLKGEYDAKLFPKTMAELHGYADLAPEPTVSLDFLDEGDTTKDLDEDVPQGDYYSASEQAETESEAAEEEGVSSEDFQPISWPSYRGSAGRAREDGRDGISRSSPVSERAAKERTNIEGVIERDYGIAPTKTAADMERAKGIAAALVAIKSPEEGSLPRFLLGDGTGFGKTRQQLIVADQILKWLKGKKVDNPRVLIVVKSEGQFTKTFGREAAVLGIEQKVGWLSNKATTDRSIVGTSYTKLSTISQREWDLVIFDEAHHGTSESSTSTAMTELTDNARGAIFSTATPATSMHGLGILANILGIPLDTLYTRLGITVQTKKGASDEGDNYAVTLVSGTYKTFLGKLSKLVGKLRTNGQMVARSFDRRSEIETIPLARKDTRADKVVQFTHSKGSSETISPAEAEHLITSALTAATSMQDQDAVAKISGQLLSASDSLSEVSKVPTIKKQIMEALAAGESPIVMLERRSEKNKPSKPMSIPDLGDIKIPAAIDMLTAWARKQGIAHSTYSGTDPVRNITEWQNNADHGVLFVTYAKGGAGIDLDYTGQEGQGNRRLIIATRPKTLWEFDQLLGRVMRANTVGTPVIKFLESDFLSDINRTARALDGLELFQTVRGDTSDKTELVPTATRPRDEFEVHYKIYPIDGGNTVVEVRGIPGGNYGSEGTTTPLYKISKPLLDAVKEGYGERKFRRFVISTDYFEKNRIREQLGAALYLELYPNKPQRKKYSTSGGNTISAAKYAAALLNGDAASVAGMRIVERTETKPSTGALSKALKGTQQLEEWLKDQAAHYLVYGADLPETLSLKGKERQEFLREFLTDRLVKALGDPDKVTEELYEAELKAHQTNIKAAKALLKQYAKQQAEVLAAKDKEEKKEPRSSVEMPSPARYYQEVAIETRQKAEADARKAAEAKTADDKKANRKKKKNTSESSARQAKKDISAGTPSPKKGKGLRKLRIPADTTPDNMVQATAEQLAEVVITTAMAGKPLSWRNPLFKMYRDSRELLGATSRLVAERRNRAKVPATRDKMLKAHTFLANRLNAIDKEKQSKKDAADPSGLVMGLIQAGEAIAPILERGGSIPELLAALSNVIPASHELRSTLDSLLARQASIAHVPVTLSDTLGSAAGDITFNGSMPASISISSEVTNSRQAKALLHELTHAATVANLDSNPSLMARMRHLMVAAVTRDSDAYGFKDVYEFVAEGFSSESFRDLLRDVPIKPKGGSMARNAWDAFVEIVKKLLNISSPRSVLDELISAQEELFAETQVDFDPDIVRVMQDAAVARVAEHLKEMGRAISSGYVQDVSLAFAKLPLMTTAQITKSYSHLFDGYENYLKKWWEAVERRGVIARESMAARMPIYQSWAALADKDGTYANEAHELMGLSTVHGMWLDREFESEENGHLWRVRKKDKDGNTIYERKEGKAYDAKADIHAELKARFDKLPKEWKAKYRDIAESYGHDWQETLGHLLTNIAHIYEFDLVDSNGKVTSKFNKDDFVARLKKDPKLVSQIFASREADGRLIVRPDGTYDPSSVDFTLTETMRDQVKEILSGARLPGPYFPLRRYGDYVVSAKRNEGVKRFFYKDLTQEDLARIDKLVTQNMGKRKAMANKAGVILDGASLATIEKDVRADARRKVLAKKAEEWRADKRLDDITIQFDPAEYTPDGIAINHYEEFVGFFERPHHAQKQADELKDDGWDLFAGKPTKKREYMGRHSHVSPDLLRAAQRRVPEGESAARITNMLEAAFVDILQETSIRKANLKRKNIRGWSNDMIRGYANHVTQHGHSVAGLQMNREILNHISGMNKLEADNTFMTGLSSAKARQFSAVSREVMTREASDSEFVTDNKFVEYGAQLGFLWYLTSIAYTLVNATQPWLIAMPWLSARTSEASASRALYRANKAIIGDVIGKSKQVGFGFGFVKGKRVPPEVFNFITVDDKGNQTLGAELEAKILASDLADPAATIAMLKNLGNKGLIDMTFAADISSAAAGTGKTQERVLEWARVMPHLTELLNRATVATAAFDLKYRETRDVGIATEFAERAVEETQFNYSLPNKARYMSQRTNPLLAPATMFLQHPQHIYYLMLRDTMKSYGSLRKLMLNNWKTDKLTPQELAQAKLDAREAGKTVIGISAMHMLVGGVAAGIFEPAKWLMGAGIALASAFDDEDETPRTVDQHIREFLSDLLGSEMGYVAANGMFPSISRNISLGSMLTSDSSSPEGREGIKDIAFALTGPLGAIVGNWAEAGKSFKDGDFLRGWQQSFPRAVRDMIKAYELQSDGLVDTYGNTIIGADRISSFEVFQKSIGINPANIREVQDKRWAIKSAQQHYINQVKRFKERWVRAKDPSTRADILQDIRAFNANLPPSKRLSRGDLMKSAATRAKHRRAMGDDVVYLPNADRYLKRYGEPYNVRE